MPRRTRLPWLLIVLGVVTGITAFAAPTGWREGAYLLGAGCAVGTVLARLRAVPGEPRRGWLLLGAGLALRMLGDVTWVALTLIQGPDIALPTAADGLFVGHYLTVSAALLVLARREAPSRVVLLDAVITTAGLLLPAWLYAVEPYLRSADASGPAVATALAYVVCVLLMAAASARLLFAGGYEGRGYALTAAAAVTLVLGDAVYLTEISRTGSTASTGLTYLLWTAAYVQFGVAVRYPMTRRRHLLADDNLTWRRCAVFVLVAVSAPVLWIVRGRDSAQAFSPVAPAVIVAVLSVLLIVRLAAVARVAQRRAAELDQRSTALDAALTRQQALQDELTYRALHDPLTGLGNRAMLTERLELALRPGTAGTALLLGDLDGFKDINDTYGHPAGDQLLVEVSRRLRDTVPPDATLARLGGDEFVVLLADSSGEEATALAGRIVAVLARPYPIGGRPLRVTTSIGILVTDGPTGATEVLRDADIALYAAKNAGKNAAVRFAPELRAA